MKGKKARRFRVFVEFEVVRIAVKRKKEEEKAGQSRYSKEGGDEEKENEEREKHHKNYNGVKTKIKEQRLV